MKNEKNLCLIPARGGSKRIPRKNIQPLNGKPLVAYTIEAAVQSNRFSNVIVSSEEEEILDIAGRYMAQTDQRPPALGGDVVKAVEVCLEFIERPENLGKWQNVAMCLPTCPFRTKTDVNNAMEIFLRYRTVRPRLIGVSRSIFPPQLSLRKKAGEEALEMREPACYAESTRSQDFEELYYPNGSIFIASVRALSRDRTFFAEPMSYYVMPAERSFDIDYPYQFQIAEFWARHLHGQR